MPSGKKMDPPYSTAPETCTEKLW